MAEFGKNTPKSSVAKREEDILKFWQENRIFEKSKEKKFPKGEFVFYDGPPFATGLPHYGNILAGTIKDAIPRYKTMRGYRVRRKWGWDCHGLPLENEIEKQLNLKSKKDIEELGIKKFNETARSAVLRYADNWKKIVPRMGRWVDMERGYRTMDATYTESVWWIFKKLFDKNLIYEGFKSMHLCPRCGTTLSNFEVALGYKDITDFSVVVKLPIEGEKNTYLLVWTTTPWTLPGNMAVAVNRDVEYVKAKVKTEKSKDGEMFILAEKRVEEILKGHEYEIVEKLKGESLLGKSYSPPFPYFLNKDIGGKENAWKIYHASYVSMEEGTGAVHLAPAFGADDLLLAQKENIPIVHHVGRDGKFTSEVSDFSGLSVKPKDDHQSADIEIIKHLAHRELLFKKEKIKHSYPHCWRCDTPLLNYASSSWFLKVTSIKKRLLSENKKVNWIPEDIGEKRFGNWIKGSPDWAISRARYWGATLPVWRNEKTGACKVMGSVEDLKKRIKRSGNTYFIVRHGEALFNTKNTLNANPETNNPLTESGRSETLQVAKELKSEGVDLIFHSPLPRTRETAQILKQTLNLKNDQVIEDNRLSEVTFGEFEGRSIEDYHSFFEFTRERMTKSPKGGETWDEVKNRISEFLYEIERVHTGKRILIVSHNGPLQMLQAGAEGATVEQCADRILSGEWNVKTAESRELPFIPLPHNADYELDLHRPYIDDSELTEKDGTPLRRIPDVFDCWFESGSMPYGEHHYPFENTDVFNPRGGWLSRPKGYPADFIAEGLDQTRGWFYSLLVLGVALFGKAPYKNVIVNGMVLAENGQKMSKSLKNYPDPMGVVESYGADSLRYYLLSSPIVRGEELAFSEKGVGDIMRKLLSRLENVHSFYALYAGERGKESVAKPNGAHVLDRWILARLEELAKAITDNMERYELDRATRPIADFIDDLSTWYIRRSRERFKGEDAVDKKEALATTRFVLEKLSRLIAPFMPFYAESLYLNVRGSSSEESVHLCEWPEVKSSDRDVIDSMRFIREKVSLSLEARTRAGIKVRQPIALLKIKKCKRDIQNDKELVSLIKEEVNVKRVAFDDMLEEEVEIDTVLTPDLKQEGATRDFIRFVQDLRKQGGLTPSEKIELHISANSSGEELIEVFGEDIQKATLAKITLVEKTSGEKLAIDHYSFTVLLKKPLP